MFSAYELYSDEESHSHTVTQVGTSQRQDKNKTTKAERFRKAFSYEDVTVHFVGAWYVMLTLLFLTPFGDDKILGIPCRLLGSCVPNTCSLGQSTG